MAPSVDIIFAHRDDPNVPMLEIVRAFNWLIAQGKAFYWATSMWTAARIEEAHRKPLYLVAETRNTTEWYHVDSFFQRSLRSITYMPRFVSIFMSDISSGNMTFISSTTFRIVGRRLGSCLQHFRHRVFRDFKCGRMQETTCFL